MANSIALSQSNVIDFAKFSSTMDKSLSKEKSVHQENVSLENQTGGIYTPELEADCATFSAMDLREKYSYEASVHKNSKHACKGKFKF
jgi:hypothetical protein